MFIQQTDTTTQPCPDKRKHPLGATPHTHSLAGFAPILPFFSPKNRGLFQ